ncbi:TRAP transporter small permease [Alkalibacter saccharofermentans]|uniref:TRAP-type C4-dicarboxylate transport system, small permease component n=1 Tax=Alkalibacter saccharofermentans DSM 14828 TaxID=1120975 RepID=A0A1M4W2B3_9FIRM|nr:TRAP transporter small permease subunit [Alkalibacter saccharofermentans]SHE75368.1 TRAP-type C4-dicarboxylate transport system, small permease component [Alkalibacter saccharofermentans DSM 14828]
MSIEKGIDRLFKIINVVCRLLLLTIFIVMWVVVFGRYLLNKTPIWGEELVLLALVWLGMLSGADALRNDLHIKITIIDKYVSTKFLSVQEVIYDILITAVSAALLYYAVVATANTTDINYMGLKISEAFAYAAMPAGYGLFLVVKFEKYYKKFKNRLKHKEAN